MINKCLHYDSCLYCNSVHCLLVKENEQLRKQVQLLENGTILKSLYKSVRSNKTRRKKAIEKYEALKGYTQHTPPKRFDILRQIQEIATYDVYTSHTELCIKLNKVLQKCKEVLK